MQISLYIDRMKVDLEPVNAVADFIENVAMQHLEVANHQSDQAIKALQEDDADLGHAQQLVQSAKKNNDIHLNLLQIAEKVYTLALEEESA